VLVEKYQYFSAVTAGGIANPDSTTATALTQFRWTCAPEAGRSGHATSGACELWKRDEALGFSLIIHDAARRPVYRASGEGFEFSDRDFPAWRERSRQATRAAAGTVAIDTAPASAVGVGPQGRSFVTPVQQAGGMPTVTALVPTRDGFHPRHPFHTGSGDHVNAGHLVDCVLQAAHLVHTRGGVGLVCTGGEAQFSRFVELNVPFTIAIRRLERTEDAGLRMETVLAQAGRENARIMLDLRDAETDQRPALDGG
jgi:hypothetical protein